MSPIDHSQKLTQFLTHRLGDTTTDLSKHEIETLYAKAQDYYQNADYESAVKAFSHLSQIAPRDHRFHLGHGASLKSLELYTDAIRAYMIASKLDVTNLEATLSIGYCLIQIQQYEEAKNVLNLVLKETRNNDAQQRFYLRAKFLISQIQQLSKTEH